MPKTTPFKIFRNERNGWEGMKNLAIRLGSMVMMLLLLVGCSHKNNYEELLAASWFEEGESEPIFTLYSDGTCEIDNEYGTGKWSIVNEDQLKLTNYYGETETVSIISIEDGCLTLGDSSGNVVLLWNTAEKALAASSIEDDEADLEDKSIEYYSWMDYSDGYAWIQYGKQGEKYWASIDKAGKVMCEFNADTLTEVLPYENGYAYLKYNDKFEIIDAAGNITSSFTIDDDTIVKGYGDGYVLIQKYAADFDSSGYTYTIYNYDGTVLLEFESEDELSNSRYCGDGVFGFDIVVDGYNGYPNAFYSAKDGKLSGCLTSEFDVVFLEDTAAMAINYFSPEATGYRGKLCLMNKTGEINEIPLYPEYGWNWSTDGLSVNENICVLYEFLREQLLSYDLTTGEFYKLDESYAEKVIWDELPNPLAFFNDRIVLPMKGNDGSRYIVAFDHKWNPIFEPIKATSNNAAYSGNRIVVSTNGDVVVYDENGAVVFSLSEKGFSSIGAYHDGVVRIADENISPTYLDENGDLLFEEIDFGNEK